MCPRRLHPRGLSPRQQPAGSPRRFDDPALRGHRRHADPIARRGRNEKTLSKTIARYGRVDLLCIDELGYMQLHRRGAGLLFQVLTEREENASVAIASNERFSGWTKTFAGPRLCTAIVDRLTFGGTIIETGTDSYRLAHTNRQLAQQ